MDDRELDHRLNEIKLLVEGLYPEAEEGEEYGEGKDRKYEDGETEEDYPEEEQKKPTYKI